MSDWTLYIRNSNYEPLSFNPYWVQQGTVWVASRPALTVFPAFESDEMVCVTWTMDERKGRRRVDAIEIVSSKEGTMKAVVASASTTQLVACPKDEPGSVTLNPRYVQVERRWVPEPAIATKLVQLKAGARVTVRWAWDAEGRKRITGLVLGW